MNRRKFLKRAVIATPVALAGTAAYGKFIERHAVEVVPVELELGLGSPLTIALLGDFHFDPLYEIDYLETVVAQVNSTNADLVLFAGDYVSHSTHRLAELVAILGKVESRHGRFAVLGNHDHWVNANQIEDGLNSAGISVLRNQSVVLPGQPSWFLTGLESYWAGWPNTQSIQAAPGDARHIVLVHEPDSFDKLTDARIALQLSGHTHGGQVRLPFGEPVILPTWGRKYDAGLFEAGGRRLYVNRGIGTVNKHYRVNCRPEITLLRLT